ncbi:hypothetical protein SEA_REDWATTLEHOG_12 [Gordonia phage RedWattleHog]|uniref:SWIM-type domain-containing protein n=1 Tax=Gordonia phage Stormageddon TaxID=2656541 RepID=A0A649VS95_9CAUD|nr:hypothetical protein KHQ86_gp012 [Gordonia phage Stormageddon]QGJ94875.1 hypothetical protein SEA_STORMAGEDDON_12 [Gordonia phage Stormageddon]QLF83516.1 hypothetical protein SEA_REDWATTLEHOG_12 [Gordonia phage RedWattleHog]
MSQQQVTTEFGPGVIVASESTRGQTSYKVEGNDFTVWLTAAQIPEFGGFPLMDNGYHPGQVNYENSTTLPYNPRPQFAPHSGESTIQPNQHLDTQKRLSPADSVTFEERDEVDRFPRNFARSASVHEAYGHWDAWQPGSNTTLNEEVLNLGGSVQLTVSYDNPDRGVSWAVVSGGEVEATGVASGVPEAKGAAMRAAEGMGFEFFSGRRSASLRRAGTPNPYADDRDVQEYLEWCKDYNEEPTSPDTIREWAEMSSVSDIEDTLNEWAYHQHFASRLAADENGTADTWTDTTYPSPVIDGEYPGGTNTPVDHGFDQLNDAHDEIQARLGDKYIDIPRDVDHSSLQARLDADPYRVVADIKAANRELALAQHDAPAILAQVDLEAADPQIREAAWADVRAKATRLRRSGNVQTDAVNATAIVATVTGDHGIYDVAVIRGSHLTGSSHVSEWSCSCPWGDWAFERQHTYVGRLCSHAYAALQELRATTMRKEKPKEWNHPALASRTAASGEDMVGKQVVTDDGDTITVTRYDADTDSVYGENTDPDDYFGKGSEIGPFSKGEWREASTKTSAQPMWSSWPQWDWLETADGSFAAEIVVYGELGPSGNVGTGAIEWKIIDCNNLFREVERSTKEYSHADEAQEDAANALEKYGRVVIGSRFPRDDGRLSTEPGTLEPGYNLIPQTHERHRDDLATGSPYPREVVQASREVTADEGEDYAEWVIGRWINQNYPQLSHNTPDSAVEAIVNRAITDIGMDVDEDSIRDVVYQYARRLNAAVQVQSNAFDRYMDYSEGDVGEAMWAEYREYREMIGDPITEAEIEELGPGIVREAFIDEPLVGSGTDQPSSFGTSEEYVREHEAPGYDDVTQRSDGSYVASIPENGISEDGTDDPNLVSVEDPDDIVAQFQREAGAHLMSNAPEPVGGGMDFAGAAQAFLRTAGRQFSEAEQMALMNEAAIDGTPIDQSELELGGTHYLG